MFPFTAVLLSIWQIAPKAPSGSGRSGRTAVFKFYGLRDNLGKSLFSLWLATELVKAGHVVVLLDYEMGEDDLYERLSDMGYEDSSGLERLRYLLLPDLPPLNTDDGAQALATIIDEVQATWPDLHVAVVIDTIGRAVVGEENSNDTILAFYRHAGLEMKRRGVTWMRLDHSGHDGTRARGGSAKGDDVDIVWHLVATDDGIELVNEKRRMGWVPEKVTMRRISEPILRYVRTAQSWPSGTQEIADALDRLSIPLGAATRTAEKALKESGVGRRALVVRAALKYRRMMAENSESEGRDAPRDALSPQDAGRTSGRTDQKAHSHGPDAPPDAPPDALGRTPSEPMGRTGGPPYGTHWCPRSRFAT